jgi:hypothetical protein
MLLCLNFSRLAQIFDAIVSGLLGHPEIRRRIFSPSSLSLSKHRHNSAGILRLAGSEGHRSYSLGRFQFAIFAFFAVVSFFFGCGVAAR